MQEAKAGDRVSLNTEKRLFFFQGDGGLSLTADINESGVIPKSISEGQLKQINIAISNGHIKLGDVVKKIEVPDKDSDIKAILVSGRNKIEEWMRDLRDDKTKTNAIKFSTIEKIIEFEKLGKNRKSVITVAEGILSAIGGVSRVEETEQEKLEIKLTAGEEETPETK